MLGVEPTRHAGQAQAKLDGPSACLSVGALPPLENGSICAGAWACRNSAHTLAKLAAVWRNAALRLSSVSHPEYVARVGQFFEQLAGALLMHGTGARFMRTRSAVPQVMLIDSAGTRAVLERGEE